MRNPSEQIVANVKVGNNDYDDLPFISDNSFYLGNNTCTHYTAFYGDFELCPLYKAFRFTIKPKDSSGDFYTSSQISEFKIRYRKKGSCFSRWNTETFQNDTSNFWPGPDFVFEIDDLDSEQEYRIKVYYKLFIPGNFVKIDSVTKKTR